MKGKNKSIHSNPFWMRNQRTLRKICLEDLYRAALPYTNSNIKSNNLSHKFIPLLQLSTRILKNWSRRKPLVMTPTALEDYTTKQRKWLKNSNRRWNKKRKCLPSNLHLMIVLSKLPVLFLERLQADCPSTATVMNNTRLFGWAREMNLRSAESRPTLWEIQPKQAKILSSTSVRTMWTDLKCMESSSLVIFVDEYSFFWSFLTLFSYARSSRKALLYLKSFYG